MAEPEPGQAASQPFTGDDVVDAAVRSLPAVPGVAEGDEVDLAEHIDRVTEVHRALQQRLSDLSP